MGHTIIEKIIGKNIGREVKPGDIVTVNVDRVMIHDIFIPFVKEKFEEMGFTKIWDPDKAVLIYDHLVPASQVDDTRHFRIGNEFVEKYGMKNIHRSDGICHQLMTEAGYVKPGDIAFGTDSHTTTYGCVGAFSSGIGYTEMASVLGTGKMWVKVPQTIKVTVNGKLPENVRSKDIILRLIGDLGADGATYQALEFTGSTIDEMSVASRMTMSNMAIEAGGKNGIFPVGTGLEKSDWLSFLGAYLSFIGTVIVSLIAIFQSIYYSELNERKDAENRKKEIQPIFSVKIVSIDMQLDGTAEAFSLYDKATNPIHKNVKISVENVNRFPIKHMIVFDKYITPLLKCNEIQYVHCAYYDSVDAKKWPKQMAVLTDEYERNDQGVPTWFNINYEDVDGNEMFQSFELKNFDGKLYYALNSINDA